MYGELNIMYGESLGEQMTQITFEKGNNTEVANIKEYCARTINSIEKLNSDEATGERKALIKIAQRKIQEAMFFAEHAFGQR